MADPLQGLRKATGIGADPNPPPHSEDDWLGTGVQGLLGAVGLGDDTSLANRGGQLVAAAAPLTSLKDLSHPAVQALLELLYKEPPVRNPLSKLAGEARFQIPKGSKLEPPVGTELPEGMSTKIRRPLGMQHQYNIQRTAVSPFEGLEASTPKMDTPMVKSPDELGDIASIIKTQPPEPTAKTTGRIYGGPSGSGPRKANPQIVQDIRAMADAGTPVTEIQQKYPNMAVRSLQGIIRRDNWAWVK